MQTQLPQRGGDNAVGGIGHHDQHIAVMNIEAALQFVQFRLAEKLHDIGFQLAVFGAHPGHALGAERRRNFFGVFILQNIFAEFFGLALDVDALDAAAALQNLAENRIICALEGVRHIHKPQTEPQIGTVGTGRVHRLGVTHARKRTF